MTTFAAALRAGAAVLAAASVLVAWAPCGLAQGLVTVKFASVGGLTDAPLHIAEERGYWREAGLAVEMQRMPNAPSLTSAIATNQIDVAGISVTPGLYTAVVQGLNMRIVGDKQSLRPGFSATRLVVKPELARATDAETIRDLKGRKIAVSAKASSTYMLLLHLLAKHGVPAADVQVVELAYPNMMPALTTGAIDAAVSLEPFLSQTLRAGVAKQASDLLEVVPGGATSIVPIVYSENFARNRKVAQAFMIAYVKGVRVYNDAFAKGRDRDKVIEIIARRAKVDPTVIREGFPAGFDPNQRVSVHGLEAFQKFFVEQNFIRTPIDVSKIIDPSFAEGAVAALGEYK